MRSVFLVRWFVAWGIAAFLACGSTPGDGPPEIRLGESVCATCGMIASDGRFATATIVEGERGPEPRIFDDFNCQKNYEGNPPVPPIVSRWVRDYDTEAWLPASTAFYVRSENLQTPMASGVAAFGTREAAMRLSQTVDGTVSTYGELWQE